MSSNVVFTVGRGATFKKILIWKDAHKVPINLTGATAKAEFIVGAVNCIADVSFVAAEGKIVITLSPVQTASFVGISGRFEVFITLPTGEVKKLLYGAVQVV